MIKDYFIKHTSPYYNQKDSKVMNSIAWKCYRCDLTFREKPTAKIHNELSKHPVRKIELISG
jgi:hypothetical protein